MDKIELLISAGDPAGIGYETVCKYFYHNPESPVGLLAHKWIVEKTYKDILKADMPKSLTILEPNDDKFEYEYGKINAKCGKASMQYIEHGVKLILDGHYKAIVTCPINKKSIKDAGYNFMGHTEYLSFLAGGVPVSMMLAGNNIKTTLATTHYPISELAKHIDEDTVYLAVKNTFTSGKYFGIKNPKIAVCGLNPHAGDNGAIGSEETIIKKAIDKARSENINAYGPYPADSLFVKHKEWDFIVAMYHDQGMIPVKMDSFGEAVNITLNLPFIRTSVDHGTAFDIAGKGIAEYKSLEKAVNLAKQMVEYDKSTRSI